MFYFKFSYLSAYTFFYIIEVCLTYFAEGFKKKFINAMENLVRWCIFLTTPLYKHLLSQHLVALSQF